MNLSATASPFALLANAGGVASPMGTGDSTSAFAAALPSTADAIVPPPATPIAFVAGATVPAAVELMSTTTLAAGKAWPPAAPLAKAGPVADSIAAPSSPAAPAIVKSRTPLAPSTDKPDTDDEASADIPEAASPKEQPIDEIVLQPAPTLVSTAPIAVPTPTPHGTIPVIALKSPATPIVAPAAAPKAVAALAVDRSPRHPSATADTPRATTAVRSTDAGKVQPVEPAPAGELIEQPTVCRPAPEASAPVTMTAPATPTAMKHARTMAPAIEPAIRTTSAELSTAAPPLQKPIVQMPQPGITTAPDTAGSPQTPAEPVTSTAAEPSIAPSVAASEIAPEPLPLPLPQSASLTALPVQPTAPPSKLAEREKPESILSPAPASGVPPPQDSPADRQFVADTSDSATPIAPSPVTGPETAERSEQITLPRSQGSADTGRSFAQQMTTPGSPDIAEAPRPEEPRSADPEIAARPGRIGQEMGVAIARHVSTAAGETMTVRLTPADMGRIDVRLSFDETGTLRAVVAADNPASLELLRRESADLTRALSDAGVRADGTSLRFDTRSDGGGGSAGQFWQRRQDARNAAADRGPDQPLPDDAPYRSLRTSGRIDMMA